MYTKLRISLLATAIALATNGALAQTPLTTGFSYQGQLKESGAPAGGTYDLRFRLFDAAVAGAQVGATDCVDGVMPIDGLFTVELDFGAVPFDGNSRWLEIAVRSDATPANCTAGAAYTVLTIRQPLTAVPYAMYALDGPGGVGSYWAANGSAIHNTNAGRVGIGTSAPGRVLHTVGDAVMFERAANDAAVLLRNTLNGTLNASFGLRNTGASAGHSYLSDAAGAELLTLRAGSVGIGTSTPALAMLDVVADASHWGLRVTGQGGNSAIFTQMNGNGATASIYGSNFSNAAGAIGVHGLLSNPSPGAGSSGVRGTASSTTSNDTYGVHGRHSGSGSGVFGESLSTIDGSGVRGVGFWGVYGEARTAGGYGGIFVSSEGIFGTGQALAVLGDAEVSDSLIVGTALGPPAVAKLHVVNGSDSGLDGGGFVVVGDAAGINISIDNNEIMARNGDQPSTLFLNNEGGDVRIGQNGAVASTVYVPILAITGADVAEKFPTSDPRDAVKPGLVMEIDPQNSGKLRIASGAYNRRVAGVVSGAGDIPVGAILGNLPGQEDAPAIALSGRVYVYCDASSGPIEPGDLLTTSDTAGHAMKVTDYPRAQGAIIGKAMSALAAGEKGLVLVLVNLQ